MMKKDFPFCKEGSEMKNIQNDAHPGVCAINGKRVDIEWSPWVLQDPISDTSAEWKRNISREVKIKPAHGGKGNGTRNDVLEHFKWVKEDKSFEDAK